MERVGEILADQSTLYYSADSATYEAFHDVAKELELRVDNTFA